MSKDLLTVSLDVYLGADPVLCEIVPNSSCGDVDSEDLEKQPKRSRKASVKSEDISRSSASSRARHDPVSVLVKGGVAVDPSLEEPLRSNAHVLSELDTVWHVMLNQTNISMNSNKFYLIQLLKSDTEDKYWVFIRWGRVGYRGQTSLTSYENKLEEAKKFFCDKFLAKTCNEWSNRSSFEAHPGKYAIVATKFEVPTKKEEVCKPEPEVLQVSRLDWRVQSLIGLITNLQKMEEDVLQLEYDASKFPLGNLTREQIEEGYRCLKDIENAINTKKFDAVFRDSVNRYYTCIPHDFGFRAPPLIKTQEDFKKELLLLETLKDIEVSYKVLRSARESKDNRAHVDRFYDKMHCQLHPLERDNDEFKVSMVSMYLSLGHGLTHMFSMEIVNVYSVYKEDEYRRFKGSIGNSMLLWHGSRVSNFYNILSHGLRIAPPEVPLTGYMFGKGVYFADVATKSGNYCHPSNGKCALLMLSEVALGESQVLYDANYTADKLEQGKNSTIGMGRKDGVRVPLGPLEDCGGDGGRYSLLYNEYIVYDVTQIRSRYVVEFNFRL
ncbi:unnamed protein product [Nippostrongylus brasiliensis]|uniref:Poly [ADP-ribose] polymerase n=1 Tax=Nippostrongylus brasiliensis TaxID=27835 RepID=A0A0N4XWD0_NIPBR|nr:unnamed protein product [Nippostrongylus brasiliensis]